MNASDYDVWKPKCDSQSWNLKCGLQGEHGASTAFANVARKEANKGISGAERSAAQTIENEIGSIDQASAGLLLHLFRRVARRRGETWWIVCAGRAGILTVGRTFSLTLRAWLRTSTRTSSIRGAWQRRPAVRLGLATAVQVFNSLSSGRHGRFACCHHSNGRTK
jgi:hypothetical protein